MNQPDTSTRILHAAERLFGEVGYDGVSMRDIAEKADVNKALVFYHHNNKGELFRRVLKRFFSEQRQFLQEAMDETDGDGPRRRLKAVADAYLEFVYEHRRYPHLVQSTLATNNDHIDIIEERLVPVMEWFEETVASITPEAGPLAGRQFFISLAGAASAYVTYSPALQSTWESDMLSRESLKERAEHLHWMIDSFVDRLEAEA